MKNTKKGTPKDKKIIALISILTIVIFVLAGVIIYFFVVPKKAEDTAVLVGGKGVLVTPDNVQSLVNSSKETVVDGYYTTSMNIDWNFDNGAAVSSNAYVENDISNTRTVYFELLLKDSGELLYTSPYIPVGSTLKEFALVKKLAAGDYGAVVKYHLVDAEDKDVSNVSVSVNIHILK